MPDAPAQVIAEVFERMPISLLVADGWSYTKEDLAHIAIGALLMAGYVVIRMPETAPETCCGLFVSHFRDRYVCPRCGDVWAWDEDAVEWIPTARIDGQEAGDG